MGEHSSMSLEERLEAANNAVEALTEALSHDLRTPLNTILGFAELMDRAILGPVGNPQYREYVADICREGRSMLDILNDMLDRRRFESVKSSEKDFRYMIEFAPDLISICRDGIIQLINPAGANMLGIWPAETVIGRKFKDFVHEDFHALVDGGLETLTDRTTRLPVRLRRVGGADVDVELAALRYHDETDANAGAGAVMLMARDVSERNRALLQLAQREEHIRRIMDTVVEGIVTFDEEGNIETANPSAERIFGYAEGTLIGTKAALLLESTMRDYYITELDRFTKTGASEIIGRSRDTIGLRADGTVIDLILSISALSFGGRRVFISAFHDNTKRKQAEQRLFEMATLDPLTKMPNRNVRNSRLEGAIVRLQETGGRMAVMFLDLDNFKIINDALGHTVGDDVIRMAGGRLRDIVGEYGLVAYLGGDEFSIIVDEPIPDDRLKALPERLLSAIAEPFDIQGKEVFTSASIGVANYPDDGDSVAALLKNVDLAVHEAKRKGSGIYQFYTDALSASAERRMEVERRLRRALANDELYLVFQPKIDLDTRTISGAEALLRWDSPDLGAVSPVEFIPIAEESGMIGEIGRWVLLNACETAAGWLEVTDNPCHVGVNFSAVQFLESDIVEWVQHCLKVSGLDPCRLDIELTESMLVQNPARTIETLNAIKALGVTVSMDDFGTGYSSLSYLTRFPLSSLKVDRAFVSGLPGGTDAVAIARAIISMAKHLDLKIVAEGIENESQVEFLHALGCHTGQGYLFSKPLTNQAFRQLLMVDSEKTLRVNFS
jgi:diguanylate cyclase (GGDEF)-like protein/PAS domain S-box-containing protein